MSERQWPANGDTPERPTNVLPGLLELVDLIAFLVRRSRREWRMPLLCLVSRAGAPSPLPVLVERFNTGDRQVPHVRISSATDDLRTLLRQAYVGLSADRFGRPPLRFRHFALADWLMRQNLEGIEVAKRQRELARRLGRNYGLPGNQDAYGVAQASGGLLGFLFWLAAFVLPMMLLRPLVTGRMRWFMRQQYLAPKLAGNFFAFAVRLTEDVRAAEDQSQIDRLLVHAFLQDLRVAYRRRIWRSTASRRTAYPVLLLDDVAPKSAGFTLLSMVNAVRNETGRADPLLIITSGTDVPPDGRGLVVPLQGLRGAYTGWYGNVPARRQARDGKTWYLPVEIPPMLDIDELKTYLPQITPPPRPFIARPLVRSGLALAVLLGTGIWYGPQLRIAVVAYQHGCYQLNAPGRVNVVWTDRQCIGYSDNASQFFGQSQRINGIEAQIFKQNKDAEADWAARGNRPYVTLVFLATLTRPDPKLNHDDETFVAESEGLQGMVAAQYRANLEADNDSASPYLRVIIANAGQEAQHADQVVDMLKSLVAHDHTVIGVVASVDSRKRPQAALKTLDAIGLPAITPTTSADHIGDGSSTYLQIAPPNIDQAKLVRHYVTQVLHRQDLFNYYTYGVNGMNDPDDDMYVNTLRDDLKNVFNGHYQDKFWKNGGKIDLCADNFDGVIFFGGRYSEFGAFLNQIDTDCSGKLPIVVSDDSTSRYMANYPARQEAPTNLPLVFASKGSLSSCNFIASAAQSERRYFLTDISTPELSYCINGGQNTGDLAGGWIGLTYDAARIMVRAVKDVAGSLSPVGIGQRWDPNQISPQTVYQQARQWNRTAYQGVTGPIQFDPNGVPVDKYLSLLCAPDIQRAYHDYLPPEVDSIGTGYGDPQLPRRPCTGTTP